MGSPWQQQPYAVRVDWGLRGARELVAGGVGVVVVVDVLSFTTSVTVAVGRGTRGAAPRVGHRVGGGRGRRAGCRVRRGAQRGTAPGEISLSPGEHPGGRAGPAARAALAQRVGDLRRPRRGGCRRRRGIAAQRGGRRPVGGPAAGPGRASSPRGSDGPTTGRCGRPSRTSGAPVRWSTHWSGPRPTRPVSPEAEAVRAAYLAVRDDVPGHGWPPARAGSSSWRRGSARTSPSAAAVDVSDVVPVLSDGWFAPAG